MDRSGQAQQADGQIAQCGHDLCSGVFADAATVFIEDAIAHPMEAIFDFPVAAVERQQTRGVSFFRGQAGKAIDDLAMELAGNQVGGLALDNEDLGDMGESQIAVQFRAGGDAADFQTSVRFIDRFVLRGEKLPDGGRRCLA